MIIDHFHSSVSVTKTQRRLNSEQTLVSRYSSFSLYLRNTACSNKVSDILQRLAVKRVKHSVNFLVNNYRKNSLT